MKILFRRLWRFLTRADDREWCAAMANAIPYCYVLRAKFGGDWDCDYGTKVAGKPHYSRLTSRSVMRREFTQ